MTKLNFQVGWGNNSLVGTLGLTFNNFSARELFKKGSWSPLPAGDGQRLSIRAQSSGYFFQSYNMSFTEPWLGERNPILLQFLLIILYSRMIESSKHDFCR